MFLPLFGTNSVRSLKSSLGSKYIYGDWLIDIGWESNDFFPVFWQFSLQSLQRIGPWEDPSYVHNLLSTCGPNCVLSLKRIFESNESHVEFPLTDMSNDSLMFLSTFESNLEITTIGDRKSCFCNIFGPKSRLKFGYFFPTIGSKPTESSW